MNMIAFEIKFTICKDEIDLWNNTHKTNLQVFGSTDTFGRSV